MKGVTFFVILASTGFYFVFSSLPLLVSPEAIAFGADLIFTADAFYLFFCHGISKLRRPIVTKFYTVVCTGLNFEN